MLYYYVFYFRTKESLSSTPEQLQCGLPESDMNFKPIKDDLLK